MNAAQRIALFAAVVVVAVAYDVAYFSGWIVADPLAPAWQVGPQVLAAFGLLPWALAGRKS